MEKRSQSWVSFGLLSNTTKSNKGAKRRTEVPRDSRWRNGLTSLLSHSELIKLIDSELTNLDLIRMKSLVRSRIHTELMLILCSNNFKMALMCYQADMEFKIVQENA